MVRILHIDDDLMMRKLMKHQLTSCGYEIIQAVDGETGLKLALEGKPDLIIVDRVMPGIDGIQFCRIIRLDPMTRDIPVIMLSATSKSEADEAELILVDYITKPYTAETLLIRINKQLALKKFREQTDYVLTLNSGIGIPGKKTFNSHLIREWRRAIRTGNNIALMIISVDNFKDFERESGNIEAEKCLKSVAEQIIQNLKRPADFLAKIRDKEFIVMMPETSLDGAFHLAQLICSGVESLAIPYPLSPCSKVITLSLGVAWAAPHLGDTSDQLLSAARQALLRAKASGHNRVVTYPFEE